MIELFWNKNTGVHDSMCINMDFKLLLHVFITLRYFTILLFDSTLVVYLCDKF